MEYKGQKYIIEKDEQNYIPVKKDRGQPSSQPKIMVLPAKTFGYIIIWFLMNRINIKSSFQENIVAIVVSDNYLQRKELTVDEHTKWVCEEA